MPNPPANSEAEDVEPADQSSKQKDKSESAKTMDVSESSEVDINQQEVTNPPGNVEEEDVEPSDQSSKEKSPKESPKAMDVLESPKGDINQQVIKMMVHDDKEATANEKRKKVTKQESCWISWMKRKWQGRQELK